MNHLVLQSAANGTVIPCDLGIDEHPYLPPSAVSATVYGSDGAVLVAAASQTVGVWALNGGHAQGLKTLTIATGWGTRPPQPGATLLLAAASDPEESPRELTTIEQVASVTTATLRQGLERTWATGAKAYDTVQRVSIALAKLGTLGRDYRVRLTVTRIGLPTAEADVYVDTCFDIVKHVPAMALTLAGVQTRAGSFVHDLNGWAGQAQGGWRGRLDAAHQDTLADVAARGLPCDAVMSDSALAEGAYWRLLRDAAEAGKHPGSFSAGEYLDLAARRYDEAIRVLLASPTWVDADQDLVSTPEERKPRRDTWLSL